MSNSQAKPAQPAPRREVELERPLIQGGHEYQPGGEHKPRLTQAQIERLTESGHIASGAKAPAKAGSSTATSNAQEG